MFSRRTTHCFAVNNAISLPGCLDSKIIKKSYNDYFPVEYFSLIKSALEEDIGKRDLTSFYLIPENTTVKAEIIAKEKGVIACLFIIKDIYSLIDKKIKVSFLKKDGEKVRKGETVVIIKGPACSILKGERVALNYLQHFSGIATLTGEYAEKIKSYPAKILDTRKTLPLYKFLEKYSVKIGGGYNHRFGLDDMILIKENHIFLNNGIENTFKNIKNIDRKKILLEIEVRNLKELKQAIKFAPDVIMLDNMKLSNIRKARKIITGNIKLEVSGGVNLQSVKKIAQTGVDYISIGAITHSAKALDLSLIIR